MFIIEQFKKLKIMKSKKIIRYSLFSLLSFLFLEGAFTSCKKNMYQRNGNAEIFVANEEAGTISVIDAITYKEIEKVDLKHKGSMYMPHNVQVAPNCESVWATGVPSTEGADEMVIVLKTRRNKVKEYINVGSEQHLSHVTLDDESKFAYVTAKSKGQIIKIDVDKMKEVQRFDLGPETGPHGLRYMNGKLYTACTISKEMIIVDISSGSLTHVPTGGVSVQTAVLPILGSAFVSVFDLKQVIRYDISTGISTVIQMPGDSQGPLQVYPSPDNSKVYVCDQGNVVGNSGSNKLYIINTTTNLVESTVIVGNGAHGVTTSLDGTKIFVTNLTDNTVSVVDAITLNVIQTIPVGVSPNGISFLKGK